MNISRIGFANPRNWRWHSHKSISKPMGVSHVSSSERFKWTVP